MQGSCRQAVYQHQHQHQHCCSSNPSNLLTAHQLSAANLGILFLLGFLCLEGRLCACICLKLLFYRPTSSSLPTLLFSSFSDDPHNRLLLNDPFSDRAIPLDEAEDFCWMQTVLATSLRSGVGIRFGRIATLRSSLLSCRQPSTVCRYTTRLHRRPTLSSGLGFWPAAHCSPPFTPRARLARAASDHAQGSPSRSSTCVSTSTAHSLAEPLQSDHPTMNGSNSTSPRVKRKSSPFDAIESGRPPKHHRASLNGRQSAGDNTPDVEAADLEMHDEYIDDAALQVLPSIGPDSVEWQATIENVVRNVVSIRFCQTCSFDTDPALNSEATGFVVDAERGYILTNRHVVGSGPFWGYCIFDNHEEVDAYPVYRDPVHDFGILKFDPKAIKYMPVKALTLRPDLAKGRLQDSNSSLP